MQAGLPAGKTCPGGPGRESSVSKTNRSVEALKGSVGSADWYSAPRAPTNLPVPPTMARGRDEEKRTKAGGKRVREVVRMSLVQSFRVYGLGF